MPAPSEKAPLFFQPKPRPFAPVQRKCMVCELEEKLQHREEEEVTLQLKPAKEFDIQKKCGHFGEEEKWNLKGNKDQPSTTSSKNESFFRNLSGGKPLNPGDKNFFESRMGYDFSGVKIYNDSRANQSAKNVKALAFTHGNAIVFNSGQYQPHNYEGKKLLAHELTHVVQQNSAINQTKRIQRKPTAIEIPAPDAVEDWNPPANAEFQWKNEALRKIIYPEREQSLRVFLELVKKFELKGYLQNPDKTSNDDLVSILEIDKKLKEECMRANTDKKDKLQATLPGDQKELNKMRFQKTQAQKDYLSLIRKDPERKISAARTSMQQRIRRLVKNTESEQKKLNSLELTKRNFSQTGYERKKAYHEGRRNAALTETKRLEEELAPVNEQYEQLIAPAEKQFESLKKYILEKEQKIKQDKARIRKLTRLISEVNGDIRIINQMISKLQSGIIKEDTGTITNWRLKKYREALNKMGHDALLKDVVDAFERNAASGYFPRWLLYTVVHFSGMRYANAHGTWDKSPQSLLSSLKDEEINTADEDTRKGWQSEAMVDLTAKEKTSVKGLWPGLKRKLSKNDKLVFEKFEPLHEVLMQAYAKLAGAQKDSNFYKEIIANIASSETDIETLQSEFSAKGWKLLVATRKAETDKLMGIYRRKAKAKLLKINRPRALAILKQMRDKGQIPDYAWKEITSFTELKLEITDPANLVERDARGLKNVTVEADADALAEFTKWKGVLKAWHSSGTAWRDQNQKTLSEAVMTSLVCDQIGSVTQHSRGINFGKTNPYGGPGGLRNNAMFYYDISKGRETAVTSMPRDKKSLCPEDPGIPFFKRPKKIEDFPCGASIFWTGWSNVETTRKYGSFYKVKEKPVLDKIKRLSDERKKLLEKDPNKKLPKVEKALAEQNALRKRILEERAGMALFDLKQYDKRFLPDISNIAPAFPEKELQYFDTETTFYEVKAGGQDIATYKEEKFEISDGLKHNGWTYSINDTRVTRQVGRGNNQKTLNFGSVMRVRPSPNVGDCPDGEKSCPLNFDDKPDRKLLKQWLVWKHQATVAFVLPDENKVITFDTSGSFGGTPIKGLTLRERYVGSMTGENNLFVGYHPETPRDFKEYIDRNRILNNNAANANPANNSGQPGTE